jgi:chemotaxis protein MotB
MPARTRNPRRSPNRHRRSAEAALAAALLLGPAACVTKGTYRDVVDQRDTLAAQVASAEERLAVLESTKAELATTLSEKEREVAEMRGTYDGLVADLQAEVASGQVRIQQIRNGIRVDVSDEILFPSGSAELDDHGREVLRKVAAQIAASTHRVEVEGHTDDIPIRGMLAERYATNWELAAARATRVVRLLQGEGIPGSRLRAISRAEFDPAAPNDSEEGRHQNRRIGIRLVPKGETRAADALPAAPAPS